MLSHMKSLFTTSQCAKWSCKVYGSRFFDSWNLKEGKYLLLPPPLMSSDHDLFLQYLRSSWWLELTWNYDLLIMKHLQIWMLTISIITLIIRLNKALLFDGRTSCVTTPSLEKLQVQDRLVLLFLPLCLWCKITNSTRKHLKSYQLIFNKPSIRFSKIKDIYKCYL